MKIRRSPFSWSFCTGPVIYLQDQYSGRTYKHEYGHHLQFKKYGLLYYFKVAIPSICGWWTDVLFHKNWANYARYLWYYSQPWEKEADELGGVIRF